MSKTLPVSGSLWRCLAGACLLLLGQATAWAAEIPAQADWTDQGTIISRGSAGQWDRHLFGMMTPCAVVYKDGTYFLYYIGGDTVDGNVFGDARHRKLGVATSTDLSNWTKSPMNPIWEWSPTGDWEEGISSCAAIVDGTEIVLYYNAMRSPSAGSVNSSIRVMSSTDGVNFGNDTGLIEFNSGCAGCGDELWPTSVIRSGSNWYVYYSGDRWNLYMATLSSRNTVVNTELALDLGDRIISGMAVPLDASNVATFMTYQTFGAPWTTVVRSTTFADPSNMSAELERYEISGVGSHQSYYFDDQTNQWLMFYQTSPGDTSVTDIGLMTAPSGVAAAPDPSPKAPTNLQVQ